MKTSLPTYDSDQLQLLLTKFECPVSYYAVRARFLGRIASPAPVVSPINEIQALWGGQLPAANTIDELNELIGGLVNGLWNSLTRHQQPDQPYKLIPLSPDTTVDGLTEYARIRFEEVEAFMDGLFGGEDHHVFPESAIECLEYLGEAQSFFGALPEEPRLADAETLQNLFDNMRELTRIAETEIHNIVISCTRARQGSIKS